MNAPKQKPTPKRTKQQVATGAPKTIEGRYLTRIRIHKVFALRLAGRTIREMARELKTGNHQIIRDLKTLDAALEREIDNTQATRFLNEALLELEALKTMAVERATESKGNEACGFLNSAARIIEFQVRLLQDAGILRKATQRHELTGPDGAPLPAAASLPQQIHITVDPPTHEISEKIVYLDGTVSTSGADGKRNESRAKRR